MHAATVLLFFFTCLFPVVTVGTCGTCRYKRIAYPTYRAVYRLVQHVTYLRGITAWPFRHPSPSVRHPPKEREQDLFRIVGVAWRFSCPPIQVAWRF